jgi:hypothetical protein
MHTQNHLSSLRAALHLNPTCSTCAVLTSCAKRASMHGSQRLHPRVLCPLTDMCIGRVQARPFGTDRRHLNFTGQLDLRVSSCAHPVTHQDRVFFSRVLPAFMHKSCMGTAPMMKPRIACHALIAPLAPFTDSLTVVPICARHTPRTRRRKRTRRRRRRKETPLATSSAAAPSCDCHAGSRRCMMAEVGGVAWW